MSRIILPAVVFGTSLGCAAAAKNPALPRDIVRTDQQSGTTALLIAASAVDANVAWVAGADRTYVRTTDGGRTWHAARVPVTDARKLQFRDVYAVDANTAYLLSIGPGPASRIFKTTDAGATWTTQFLNTDSAAFYDCFDFWDAAHGIVVSDAVNGEFPVRVTTDGGATWPRIPASALPKALSGEGSFASSGTCVVTQLGGHAWIATSKGRVLHTNDFGRTWRVSQTPISVSDSSGVASVAFRNTLHGMAFGGYGARLTDTLIAITQDGGYTWRPDTRHPINGGIWGGAYARDSTVIVVGTRGAAYSRDEGRTWTALDTLGYWGLGFAPRAGIGWLVGPNGRITKVSGF